MEVTKSLPKDLSISNVHCQILLFRKCDLPSDPMFPSIRSAVGAAPGGAPANGLDMVAVGFCGLFWKMLDPEVGGCKFRI
jgi:hypothetical protein